MVIRGHRVWGGGAILDSGKFLFYFFFFASLSNLLKNKIQKWISFLGLAFLLLQVKPACMQPEESGDPHGEKVNKKKSADNACLTKYPSQKPIGCVAGVQLVAMNIPQQLIGAVVSQNRKHPLWSIRSSPLSQVGRWSDQGPVKEEKLLL